MSVGLTKIEYEAELYLWYVRNFLISLRTMIRIYIYISI